MHADLRHTREAKASESDCAVRDASECSSQEVRAQGWQSSWARSKASGAAATDDALNPEKCAAPHLARHALAVPPSSVWRRRRAICVLSDERRREEKVRWRRRCCAGWCCAGRQSLSAMPSTLELKASTLALSLQIIVVVSAETSTCLFKQNHVSSLPVGAQYCGPVCYKTEKGKPATTRLSEGVDLEGELVASVVAKVGGEWR